MKDKRKKTAVVTGAAKGIGLGIAGKFAEAGYRTYLCGRGEEVFARAEELCGRGLAAEGVLCDVSVRDSVNAAVQQILDGCGRIDVLVNNAGVARLKPFEEADEALLDFHINTNLKGTWYMTQAVIPHMRERRFGRIINLASVTGYMVCDKGYAAYGMTKAGIVGLTKAVAVEYAQYGITCNAICPGFIHTPNVERSAATTNPDNPQAVLDGIASGVPVGRLGTPEEIGALAVFLASEDAGYITGTANVIDGGNMLPETNVMGV